MVLEQEKVDFAAFSWSEEDKNLHRTDELQLQRKRKTSETASSIHNVHGNTTKQDLELRIENAVWRRWYQEKFKLKRCSSELLPTVRLKGFMGGAERVSLKDTNKPLMSAMRRRGTEKRKTARKKVRFSDSVNRIFYEAEERGSRSTPILLPYPKDLKMEDEQAIYSALMTENNRNNCIATPSSATPVEDEFVLLDREGNSEFDEEDEPGWFLDLFKKLLSV